ncbi:hypothetical protein D5018_17170 [Parashewanella curva]|uniref:Uncharacterized protein n=1 Tax=Parashewanella curva TaxID=2338552 RepID=A0A3L8PSV6_9GAMM|nr:hypothetical protein [Parashewanella curva]RLV58481.1 hypothetical protein D5018_17170 [Parashewanella curva]
MSVIYEPQPWQYHYGAPRAGRKLWLIKPSEVGVMIPLVLKVAQVYLDADKQHLYFDVSSSYKVRSNAFIALSKLLKNIMQLVENNEE